MKKLLTLALALIVLAAFTGLSAAQERKTREKPPAPAPSMGTPSLGPGMRTVTPSPQPVEAVAISEMDRLRKQIHDLKEKVEQLTKKLGMLEYVYTNHTHEMYGIAMGRSPSFQPETTYLITTSGRPSLGGPIFKK